jgi:Fur family peroxide stress response transcriptional regulator
MGGASEIVEARVRMFLDECRRLGIKATHQRREIYREVARTNEHPDVQTLFLRVRQRVPEVSLDTVYRTLRMFEEKGLVARVASLDARTRFDAVTTQHHHFVCVQCGEILDLYSEQLNALPVPPGGSAFGEVQSVHVELRGVCKGCREGKPGGFLSEPEVGTHQTETKGER